MNKIKFDEKIYLIFNLHVFENWSKVVVFLAFFGTKRVNGSGTESTVCSTKYTSISWILSTNRTKTHPVDASLH
jgi:hypothetical protein